jgi:hypothetical protein
MVKRDFKTWTMLTDNVKLALGERERKRKNERKK